MTTNESIEHATFTIEREFSASTRHVFRFWSDAEMKGKWNGCHPDWQTLEDDFNFQVGGTEVKRWRTPEGDEQTFHAHYLDIVPEQRIIYAYEMSFAGNRLSASLVTVTFEEVGNTTRMKFVEQVAILAGGATAKEQRLLGTEQGMDRLVDTVERNSAAADH